MKIRKQLLSFVESQYENPRGVLGWYMGEKMIHQHKRETYWSIEKLNLQEDEHLLEIGCGAGYGLQLLAEKSAVRKVTGLDISHTILLSSRIRNKRALREQKVQLVHGSVQNLPFSDRVFSRILSIHSIYFWEDLHKAMSEIYRVLKPGGIVFITLSDGKDGMKWKAISSMVEDNLIPTMNQLNFKNVSIERGPSSRGYHTIAVLGKR
ncbi:class I SAM-dependent methyltransferase [Halobacillus mangrovi]|uniref:Methyltransferase type 11 domain-containing protein n=1 Tax=Halobacillus mangrovi TaxID=402384 RepID=A0A1W6A0F4_9BACI|nr:class I SAM-dependent methyltransferase [Halobacillus mangrovi]ARI78992.1 hypothetical protein HM131_20135 [Halobacillus mangrovi]